ncbi:MAG: hypothetical protein Q8910_00920 [Bacteroidota bacterium]|nr:hypothetical protein [Bacteroidota bacterium]
MELWVDIDPPINLYALLTDNVEDADKLPVVVNEPIMGEPNVEEPEHAPDVSNVPNIAALILEVAEMEPVDLNVPRIVAGLNTLAAVTGFTNTETSNFESLRVE